VVVTDSSSRIVVRATLDFLTSIERYTLREDIVLRELDGQWYIDLPESDPTEPPDQFTSRPSVDFLSQGRRTVTSEETITRDVLDRPKLTLGPVRSLLVDDNWVVVGDVTNIDVDPADVTITAQLRDEDGDLLATYDAAQVMVHKLLPGESSPFRVVFESLAGTAPAEDGEATAATEVVDDVGNGDALTAAAPAQAGGTTDKGPIEFDPNAITPLWLPDDATVASVEVYARAVVTSLGTNRGLQVLDVRYEENEAGARYLIGELRKR
jgi:hypothetical protein